jgi:hypothetical protein
MQGGDMISWSVYKCSCGAVEHRWKFNDIYLLKLCI